MAGECLIDFGDSYLDYDDLIERRASVIPLVINENVKCSNTDIETYRAMGLSVEKNKRPDVEKLKNFLLEKVRRLQTSRVRFLVENITFKDFDSEKKGKWRLRLDPSAPYYGDFVFNNHSIIFNCFRKQGRLSVDRIFLQRVSKRPYLSEGMLSGQVLVIEDENARLPDETYMKSTDFEWLLALPRRRRELEERLNEWNEYISTYLAAIKNKQAWITYRDLERISPLMAKIQISTKNHSKNAYQFFYPEDVVSLLDERVPNDKEWKPNEETADSELIGTIAKGVNIRKYIASDKFDRTATGSVAQKNWDKGNKEKKAEDEWIELEIELDDKYVYDTEEIIKDYDDDKISKDPTVSKDPLDPLPRSGLLVNSVFADELPLKLQEKAIDRLKEGNAVNPRLEDFVFDIKEAKDPTRNEIVERETLVENALNEKQLEALQKSLNAPDISLIQGPPGTGKTTVIAELCHQTALRGGKVLLTSQSNLAVDNALSRLANKTNIMPIRIGRHTTEEGQDFVEENVVKRWFTSVQRNVDKVIEGQEKSIDDFESYRNALEEIEELKNLKKAQNEEIIIKKKEMRSFSSEITTRTTEKSNYEGQISSMSCVLDTLSQVQHQKTYLEKEDFCKFAEICPETIEIVNKKIELIFTSSNVDFTPNYNLLELGEILAYLNNTGKYLPEIKHNFHSLKELISQLSRLKDDDEIRNQEKIKYELISQMSETTDKVQSKQLSEKICECNIIIKELRKQNNRNKLSENWKKNISSLRIELSKLSSLFVLTGSDDSKILVDKLKSSLSPDEEFEPIITKLLYLFDNIDSDPLKLPASIIDKVGKLGEDYKYKKKELKNSVEILEAELASIRTKVGDIEYFIGDKENEIESLDKRISSNLKTISKIRASRYGEIKPECEIFDPATLNIDTLEALKLDFSELKESSEPQLKKSKRWLKLQKEWSKRIENSSKEDYRDIVDIYIDFANVVGATCTETGKYRFWGKQGREFDLIIIDEVSKATPSELLMPMLLGKQIVLVGDHQQLPPTFRLDQEELPIDEVEDKESIKQKLRKFENLVTTSYFREMFEAAEPELKSRLIIQYRMHPAIMNAINQFYPPGYKLECGIPNPEESRKNDYVLAGKEGELSPKNSHVIWVDTSEILIRGEKRRNFEGREYGKYRSRYNEFEIQVIEKILLSLNKQFEAINGNDAPPQDVAIISFYAGQIRKLRTMVDKPKNSKPLNNIRYRIGTVDRFQGMERPIVIVSLVSSPYKNDPTPFVKEFRRINVAFSRAQCLLIIVGSKKTLEGVDVEIHFDDGEVSRRQSYYEIIKAAESGISGNCLIKGYDIV